MNTYPENEIKEVNDMLHNILSFDLMKFKVTGCELWFEGENFIGKISKEETLKLLKNTTDKNYLELYRALNFYYSRWIAFNIIKDSNDKYAEFSSNNALMLALTSIIDRLANPKNEKSDCVKRFISFLGKYLSEEDIKKIIKNSKVYKKNRLKDVKNLKDFSQYVYDIRSLVVHKAELGGIYPYNINFDFNFEKGKISNTTLMITPEVFRRLLWKAIFNYLDLKIIY